jgi:predicted amidophosphoribosyltransferase
MKNYPFLEECLGSEFALVPIPRSAPLKNKDALWPSRRICEALVAAGLGAEVLPLLNRRAAVQKAATAGKGMRPDPEHHYESTIIDNNVPSLLKKPITLVDDVITRGSSFVGMFRRVAEAFPNRKISCFALVRTESEITTIKSPVQGKIILHPSGRLWRSSGSAQQSNLF